MAEPKDDKTAVDISPGVKLVFEADGIKIRDREGTSGRRGVVIQLSKDEARKLCEELTAKQFQGCFSKPSEPSDPWEVWIEERQV